MSEQKHNTWQQRPFYWRIPILFGLLGGGLGGMLVGFREISEILMFIVLGAIFGFVPALITGLLAMLLKLQRDASGVIITLGIGILVSLIYSALVFRNSASSVILAVAGGLSALILSFFVLPKPNLSNNE